MSTTDSKLERLKSSQIAGIIPIGTEDELLTFSANVASAIQILDARTQVIEELTDTAAAVLEEPEEQQQQQVQRPSGGSADVDVEIGDTLKKLMKSDGTTLSSNVTFINKTGDGVTPSSNNLIGVDKDGYVGAAFPRDVSYYGNPSFIFRNDYTKNGTAKVGNLAMIETTFIADIVATTDSVVEPSSGKNVERGILRYSAYGTTTGGAFTADDLGDVGADEIKPYGVLVGGTYANVDNVLVEGTTTSGVVSYTEGVLVGRHNNIPYFTKGNGLIVVSGGTVQVLDIGTATGLFTASMGTVKFVPMPSGSNSILCLDSAGTLTLLGTKPTTKADY